MGHLAWPDDPAEAMVRSSSALPVAAAPAIAVLAGQLDGGIRDVMRALAHALLYRYLDADWTVRLELDDAGNPVARTRSAGGRTPFLDLAVQADQPVEGEAGSAANLLLCFDPSPVEAAAGSLLRIWYCAESRRMHVEGAGPPAMIERLAIHAGRMLAHAARVPETPLDELDLLDAADHARLSILSGPRLALEGAETIHAAILAQAARTPERIAASCVEEQLSYQMLAARSDALAAVLRLRGVGRGTVVAIHAPRGCGLLVAALAVLRSGAAALLLDPLQPEARLQRMLALAGARLALGPGNCPALVATAGLSWVDSGAAAEGADGAGDAEAGVSGADTAYVIFTSGSTGDPKGVAISHAAMVNRMRWLGEAYGLGEADVSLARTALSFDPAWCEMLRVLGYGGRVHFLPHGEERDPSAVAEAIAAERVSIVDLVPAPLEALLEHCRVFGGAVRLRSLRWVLAGAEELPGRLIDAFRRHLGDAGARLINGWGATETTVDATWQDCTDLPSNAPAPIGRPIGNCAIHLLSRSGMPVPPGMAGEIVASGACLAMGYLDPDETALRFRALPALGGRRAYLSGDRARLGADDVLHFAGRSGAFAKIRGVRVAPREIADAANSHAAVREAFLHVVARAEGDGEAAVLYVVPREGSVLQDEDVMALLAARLPATMLPDHCMVIPELPRNASEKIDVRRLPPPSARAPEPSSDGLTKWVQERCAALLGRPIGPMDDFFLAGGHSLAVVRLIARVAEEHGVELTVRDVYRAPRPVAIAERIADAPPIAIERFPGDLSLRASHAQRRLWLLSRDARSSLAYHVCLNLPLSESWEPGILQRAIDGLVDRHEILRTRFHLSGQELVQRVDRARPGQIPVELVELARGDTAEACLARLHSRPFDLAEGPLLRVGLLRALGQADLLWITQHHIVTDAWSMGLLIDEVRERYRAACSGEDAGYGPLRLQHRDATAWHERWLAGSAGKRARAYWRGMLAPPPPRLQLPADFSRGADRARNGAVVSIDLPTALVADFLHRAQVAGASPFMAYLATIFVLLWRWSGQSQFIVGAPFAARTHRVFEEQLGCFVNSIPLRAQVDDADTLTDVLARVRETCLDALDHQLCPFDVIVEDTMADRPMAVHPLFDVMVVVQNAPTAQSETAASDLGVIETELAESKLDLIFTFAESAGQWSLRIDYDASLYTRATVQRLSDQVQELQLAFVERPELPISSLSPPATPDDLPASQGPDTLHSAFERWASSVPARTALVFGDRRRSYGELEAAATALARRLHNSLPESRGVVAIHLDRSDRIVEAQLAVLKAGHAFLTLNPTDPPARLLWLLADSAALAVIDEPDRPFDPLPAECVRVCIDTPGQPGATGDHAPLPRVEPGDGAYVIYTSGSTGTPKGVLVRHRSVRSLLEAASGVIPPHDGERWSVFHAFSFDFSVWETFVPLSRGGAAVVAADAVRRDAAAFAALLRDAGVTVLSQVPTAFEHVGPKLAHLGAPQLRWVVFGGEPVNLPLLRQIMPRLAAARFLNGYGITETTVFSTFKLLDATCLLQNVGTPLANQRIWVMDSALRPVMPGAVGEICIGGPAVASGYLNQPEGRASGFVDLPGWPGVPLYRSGDFGRWNADGELLFLGRRDRQVKRHGYRIELDEIRVAALGLEGVEDCAVLPVHTMRDEPEIVAFFAAPGSEVEALRARLRRILPHYMVPDRLVILDRFPTLDNGKTDASALNAMLVKAPSPAPVPLESGPIACIMQAMRDAVGVPDLGPDDDFFRAGGHSLAAIRVLAEIEAVLGHRLELEILFDQPTARALAALIPAAVPAGRPPEKDLQAGPCCPASAIQAGLWAIEHFRTADLPCTLVERCELAMGIDRDRCAAAFAAVFARFDIFRTIFSSEAGMLLQCVDADGARGATFRVVQAVPGRAFEAQVADAMAAEASLPFDLAAGPLVRLSLLYREGAPAVLICAAHHAVWDGASLDLTVAAWQRAYAALGAGDTPPPRLEREQYITFLRRQAERAATAEGQNAIAFWRDRCGKGGRLDGLPLAAANEHYVGSAYRFALEGAPLDALRALCAERGATLFAGVQAVVRGWLWLRWAASDVAIGSPIMRRQGRDFAETPGPFLNHVVLRVAVKGTDTLRSTIARAADEIRAGLHHAFLPPESALPPGAGRMFDVGLTLQSPEARRRALDTDHSDGRVFGIHTPLWLDATPLETALLFDVVANHDYFDPQSVPALGEDARRRFAALIAAADTPLAAVAQAQSGLRVAMRVE
ncbi:MAG: amino acid adenylation domain-containing protein [Pseudomonadota bacterium]